MSLTDWSVYFFGVIHTKSQERLYSTGIAIAHSEEECIPVGCVLPNLRKKLNKLQIVQQGTDYHEVYSNFFLSCWTNDVEDFPKVTWIIFPPSRQLRFSIVVLETF